MTSVIHFKFRSALLSETLNFDGDYLSLLDLKRLIAKKKGLLNAADIDFAITNKITGEEYTKEDTFIPKNTEVLVKKTNAKPQLEALRTNPTGSSAAPRPLPVPLAKAVASDGPALPFSSSAVASSDGNGEQELDEDALLKKMIEEQNEEWQRSQLQRRQANFPPNNQKFAPGGSGAKPPSHYICNRCEKPGHWKKDCPTMGDPAFDERKFAVGVPICRTRVLADQSGLGAGLDVMRLPDGRLVQCVPAEYVLLALTISNSAAYEYTTLVCACADHSARISLVFVGQCFLNNEGCASRCHFDRFDYVPLRVFVVEHNQYCD
jgi:hypothetical protein